MTEKKKFMDLTDKKYPVSMDLVQMAHILVMYHDLDPRIWKQKKRKDELRPLIEEIKEIWDSWARQRNEYIKDQIDSGKWNNKSGSVLGEKEE